MRYYLIAGEASGDMHSANLMEQIKQKDKHAHFRFWGGDRMQMQGGELVRHYKYHAFMGFAEVLLNFRIILKNLNQCKKDLLRFKPDLLILVDYPGFNMRIAAFAQKNGFKVAYYISPQIWAWRESRVKKIKKTVDRMFVILPFEKDFYRKHNMQVDFVGHPLLDELGRRNQNFDKERFKTDHQLDERPLIALLPGSRKQEIKRMLPVMVKVSKKFPGYQFVIAGTDHIPQKLYGDIIGNQDVKLIINQTYPVLQMAHAGMITSGTASLEAALFRVPQLVMYKAAVLSYLIAKQLVKLDYISLANLVLNKPIFKEFIQQDCSVKNVAEELQRLINDENTRNTMLENYELLKEKLGGEGASERAAGEMAELARH
ncbi:MAG: lipid-A-disaccharide synthase [Bacteroidales bacterium]